MIALDGASVASPIVAQHDLGKAEGACRAGETGPALLVDVAGLRDRAGLIKLEVYPADEAGFLADDSTLVASGRVFRRVEQAIPAAGPVRLCVRVPAAGRYAVVVLHDRNADHRFTLVSDGIGFAGNPKLGWARPRALAASAVAGPGLSPLRIVMNYRHGLTMRPER